MFVSLKVRIKNVSKLPRKFAENSQNFNSFEIEEQTKNDI